MPRAKKDKNLEVIGKIKNTAQSVIENNVIKSSSIQISLSSENKYISQSLNNNKGKFNFKKSNFQSKFRSKEKNARIAKNIKNMVQDTLDSISYNLYQGIEAGPSMLPKKKYCDITGFESTYKDPRTGLRYYNSEIFKIASTLTEPIKNQYLSMRKALFIIK